MIKLEPIRPHIQLRRAWTIFFSDGEPGIWKHFTRKGFRHVEAAAYFADQDRWVFVLPRRARLLVEVKRPDEAGPYLAGMLQNATAALRFNGLESRFYAPALTGCVGTVKALCGIRSRALSPFQLYRDLLAQGAEPCVVSADEPARLSGHGTVRQRPSGGRPGREASEGSGASESGARPHPGDAGAVAA